MAADIAHSRSCGGWHDLNLGWVWVPRQVPGVHFQEAPGEWLWLRQVWRPALVDPGRLPDPLPETSATGTLLPPPDLPLPAIVPAPTHMPAVLPPAAVPHPMAAPKAAPFTEHEVSSAYPLALTAAERAERAERVRNALNRRREFSDRALALAMAQSEKEALASDRALALAMTQSERGTGHGTVQH